MNPDHFWVGYVLIGASVFSVGFLCYLLWKDGK